MNPARSIYINSGCCFSDVCSPIDNCSTNKIYLYQAIICIALVAVFSIYLFAKLKRIKQDFNQKKDNMENMDKMKYN